MVNIALVVTSHDQLGATGNKTGWYLPEVAHPYSVFTKAGHSVTFISPKGGKAPMDPGSLEAFKNDQVCITFLDDKTAMAQLNNTKTTDAVYASDFKVIFYAGGHGPMFDLPDCKPLAELAAQIYEKGGIVGAVCHGTVGLLPIQLSNGQGLLKGQTVTSFTNTEEEAVGLTEVMPFLLETKLKQAGATFVGVKDFQPNVQVSGRIVTGQNPASATATAEAILTALG